MPAVNRATGTTTVVGSPATSPEIPSPGVEQIQLSPRKRRGQSEGDVKSDVAVENRAKAMAVGDAEALADLAARLASLPPEVLAALHALFSGAPRQP